MAAQQHKTLAIVGAGIIGLCAAIRAQLAGYRVTLIDQGQPGSGASHGNAGFLATETIAPLSTASNILRAPLDLLCPNRFLFLNGRDWPVLAPWLRRFVMQAHPERVRRNRDTLARLNQQALPAWQHLLRALQLQDELVASGYLLLWETPHRQEAVRLQRQLASFQIACELLGASDVRQLEPNLTTAVHHALRFKQACRFRDPAQLCQKLFKRFQQQGGRFWQTQVTGVRSCGEGDGEAGGIRLAVTADSAMPSTAGRAFSKVLVAAGAYSADLLAAMGLTVPLIAERGYHITVPHQQGLLSHTVGSWSRKVVISPLSCGLRIVGISDLASVARGPSEQPVRALAHHLPKLLPQLSAEDVKSGESWMGRRPTLPDALPVVGCHPDDHRILFAFGHQHLGMTQAAVTSELVMDLLLADSTDAASASAVDRGLQRASLSGGVLSVAPSDRVTLRRALSTFERFE